MNRTQQMALDLVLSRLDPTHPDFAGTPEIGAALSEDRMRRYLDTWVMPLVTAARNPEVLQGFEGSSLRDSIRRQYGNRAQSAAAARRYKESQP